MKSLFKAILFALPLVAFNAATAATPKTHHETVVTPSAKVVATSEALRDLWTDHIFWIRNVVMATADKNAAERKTAEAQVVANAKQIAGAIEPYYGKAASDQLFTLLAGHWGAIRAYLDATYAGDSAGANKAQKDLNDNAVAIATFLSSANPNWPKATLVSLLTTHGAHHIAQILDVHAGDYDKEAINWAVMRMHMNTIADALAGGIAKQFPDKF
jgi:hypothetical protein